MATVAPSSPPTRPLSTVEPLPTVCRWMSEHDYTLWTSGHDRTEWVAGEVIDKMSESLAHDVLRNWLTSILSIFVRQRSLGHVHGPEFSMRLPERPSRRNPDILFVAAAHAGRVTPTFVDGPADLVIEVVSPDSVARDYRTKYLEYQASRVPEYWIADPLSGHLEPYRLNADGSYESLAPDADGKIHSAVVHGFWLRPADLFADPRPGELTVLAGLGVR